MKKLPQLFLWMAIALFAFSSAHALPLPLPADLDVDFRDYPWSAGYNKLTYTNPSSANGAGVTVSARDGNPNAFKGLYQDSIDGFGILGGENDEIDNQSLYGERLFVILPQAYYIKQVAITDLFDYPDGGNASPKGELGRVNFFLNGNFVGQASFDGQFSDQTNGEQLVFAGFWADEMRFKALDGNSGDDFSVAGFNYSVPEPTTLLLLGAGLIGFAGISRRRFRN